MPLRQPEAQVARLRASLAATEAEDPRTAQNCAALATFDPVWVELTPVKRVRLQRSLVEQIAVDGHTGKLRPSARQLPSDTRRRGSSRGEGSITSSSPVRR